MADNSSSFMRMDDLSAALEEVKAAKQDVAMAESNAEKAAAKKKLAEKKAEAKKIEDFFKQKRRNFEATQAAKKKATAKAVRDYLARSDKTKKTMKSVETRRRVIDKLEAARADPERMMDATAMGFEGPSSKSFQHAKRTLRSRSKRYHPYAIYNEPAPRTITSFAQSQQAASAAAAANEMLGGRRRTRRALRNRRSRNRKH